MITLPSGVRSLLISSQEIGSLQTLRRESILFRQGHDANAIYLVESGLIKLTRSSKHRNQILAVIGPNQLCGEESLADGTTVFSFEAECLTDATAYKLPVSALKRLFGVPEVAAAFVSYAIRRDAQLIQRIEMLANYDVEQRILHGLAELGRLVTPHMDHHHFPIPMTQAEIASFVGATRETTSTTLSQLKSRKLVALARRLVTTVHPDILIGAANERLSRPRGATLAASK